MYICVLLNILLPQCSFVSQTIRPEILQLPRPSWTWRTTTRMRFESEFTCSADGLQSQIWIEEYFYCFCAQSFSSIMLYWVASVSILQTIYVSSICWTKMFFYLCKHVDNRGFWCIKEYIRCQYSALRGLGIHYISL